MSIRSSAILFTSIMLLNGIASHAEPADRVSATKLTPALDVGATLSVVTKAIDPDPSVHSIFNNICNRDRNCNGFNGRLRWPSLGGLCYSQALPDLPFVAVLPGNGYGWEDYEVIQDHLAANGFASLAFDTVASVESVMGHQQVADDVLGYLESVCFNNVINDFDTAEPIDFDRTAIVGHSRGGESARYLAAELSSHPDYDVRAVVSLAPTRSTFEFLFGTQSDSYMVLYGTHDADVNPEAAYTSHDIAGWNEISTPSDFDLERVMKLMQNYNHIDFMDDGLGSRPQTTAGYLNAFLRGWLNGDWQFYSDWVIGESVPGGFGSSFTQFSDGSGRRVIDSFQHLATSPSTIGDTVFPQSMSSFGTVGAGTIAETPHASWVMRFVPNGANSGFVWNIPAGQRNFSSFDYLSLRIGRLDGVGPEQFNIGIRNGNAWSYRSLEDYGAIPEITPLCIAPFAWNPVICGTFDDYGHMRTIRIPLGDFGPHDNVTRIRIGSGVDAIGETFILDNLEVSDSTFGTVP